MEVAELAINLVTAILALAAAVFTLIIALKTHKIQKDVNNITQNYVSMSKDNNVSAKEIKQRSDNQSSSIIGSGNKIEK